MLSTKGDVMDGACNMHEETVGSLEKKPYKKRLFGIIGRRCEIILKLILDE
jgi:hypothetical protein